MAAFTKTVTNRVQVFGGGAASYFDRYNWNEFYWGDGTAPVIHTVGKTIGNSLRVTEALSDLTLRDRAGWKYNFHDRVTNATGRYEPTWTQVTVASSVV